MPLTYSKLVLLSLLPAYLIAQLPSRPLTQTPARHNLPLRWQLSEPAVPPDPLELVTGVPDNVETVTQREATISLLSHAFRKLNPPDSYVRKTNILTLGATGSEGAWQVEESSMASSRRLAVQGPGFSLVHILKGRIAFCSHPAPDIPLRLAQVFGVISQSARPAIETRDTLRVAPARLNGVALQCILYSRYGAAQNIVGGRRWEEAEYCLNPSSGSLVTISLLPGIYILYDYSQPIHFHDETFPNQFTVTEAGRTLIEAKTVSIAETPKDPTLFDTAGLHELGVGSLLQDPARNFMIGPWPNDSSLYPAHIVIFHGVRSSSGQIADVEILSSSDNTLNEKARERFIQIEQEHLTFIPSQSGATPQSREIFQTCYFPNLTP